MWVTGDVKFAPVCSNKGIPAHKTFWREKEIKLAGDVAESIRKKLCPLLDECGSSGDFIGQEIKIFQKFMADAAAFHAKGKMDELNEPQLAVMCKILSGVFDKPDNVV